VLYDEAVPSLSGELPPSVDVSAPNSARIYDYLLGGAHNFAADRKVADQAMAAGQISTLPVRANREFLRRVIRFMIESGVSQFLDLGSGIPTAGNVHEIAQQANPDARVVYVDNEPVTASHARHLLAGNANAAIIEADVRDPDIVLDHPDTARLLDFDRPVGIVMVSVLQFVPDADRPADLVATYRDAAAAGGFLALSHYTTDGYTVSKRRLARRATALYEQGTNTSVVPRSRTELAGLLTGLDLIEPGIVWAPQWHPDGVSSAGAAESEMYAAVTRIPSRT
jgi:S-adenosyl methyltransferase